MKHQPNENQTRSNSVDLSLMAKDIQYIQIDVREIKESLRSDYATKEELMRVEDRVALLQKLVYGFVGLILTTVVVALISLVIRKGN